MIDDRFALASPTADVVWSFILAVPPRLAGDGVLSLDLPGTPAESLLLRFDPAVVTPEIEPVPVTDPLFLISWGRMIYRVRFRLRAAVSAADVQYHLTIAGR